MAEDRFIDYFDYAELDPAASREENYSQLQKSHLELNGKRSKDAQLAEDIITKAMAAFSTPETYAAYRARWEQRQAGRAGRGPRDQPAAAPAGQQPSAVTPPKGLKAALLQIGATALRTALENRAGGTGQQAGAAGAGAGLTGTWRDNTGATLQVRQVGANVAITVMNGFGQVVSQGQGVLAGQRIDYQARDAAGQSGRGVLMVSPDGRTIEGEIAWTNGFNMPAGSGRVQLVRA